MNAGEEALATMTGRWNRPDRARESVVLVRQADGAAMPLDELPELEYAESDLDLDHLSG